MGDVTPFVGRALDEFVPPRPAPDRWRDIERAALGSSRRRALVAVATLPVAAAVALLVLAWPFSGGPTGTLLERAAAAIGDGPVVHAVVQSGFAGTEIDLATERRVSVHEEDELALVRPSPGRPRHLSLRRCRPGRLSVRAGSRLLPRPDVGVPRD